MTLLAATALSAALFAAGCGDDDEEEPQALTGATGATGAGGATGGKEEFIAAADEICGNASDEVAAEAREQYPEGPPTGENAEELVAEVIVPSLQRQHDEIAALTPPEGEEDTVEDLLAKFQDGIDAVEADPVAFIEEGDTSDVFAEANAAADDLGLKVCGSE